MYATVPISTPGFVGCDAVTSSLSTPTDVSLARPKSRIFTLPSVVRKRFSGLRSRWTMPLR
jgi:hypothetical protein